MTDFAEVQFPSDISYGATGGPTYSTDVVTTYSGREQRNSNWSQARARYNVASGVKTETQWQVLKEFASKQVVLALPMGKTIQAGDTFNAIAGCDKTKQTCISKFSNIINFRGEPDVLGMDKMLTTAGTMDKTNRNG